MTNAPPVLPDSAPFTPEQRGWLNGYLAATWTGFAGGGGAVAEAPAGHAVTILWGSQTGTAEGVAKKMAKKLSAEGHVPTVVDMAEFECEGLSALTHVLIITSTYGEGEPPDNAADLYEALMGDAAPELKGLEYSVFALGDNEYPDFCKCGIEFDERLADLGAKAIAPRIDVDVDVDEPFAVWETAVVSSLVIC
ncbi:MAG: flavodoxin domain-containing protein [Akkermansiaceae bacterium]|nr:flavodoxin domain-containing protein [Akkermansiaceae bacterium]